MLARLGVGVGGWHRDLGPAKVNDSLASIMRFTATTKWPIWLPQRDLRGDVSGLSPSSELIKPNIRFHLPTDGALQFLKKLTPLFKDLAGETSLRRGLMLIKRDRDYE